MTEKKQKRYPTDRLKLHALLEKKEKELVRLREEVEEIRKLVQQADASAINATAAQYNVTPEQLRPSSVLLIKVELCEAGGMPGCFQLVDDCFDRNARNLFRQGLDILVRAEGVVPFPGHFMSREQLAEIMKKLYGDKTKPVPELPKGVTESDGLPDEKEDSIDDDNA